MNIRTVVLGLIMLTGVAEASEPEWVRLSPYPGQTICTHYAGTLGVWPPTLVGDKVFEVYQFNDGLEQVGYWTMTSPQLQESWMLDVEESGAKWLQGKVTGEDWVAETGLVAVDCQVATPTPEPTEEPQPTPTPFRVFLPMVMR